MPKNTLPKTTKEHVAPAQDEPPTEKKSNKGVFGTAILAAIVVALVIIVMPKGTDAPKTSSPLAPPPPTSEELASAKVVSFAKELVATTDPESTCKKYVAPNSAATVCDKFKQLTPANIEIFKPIATWGAPTASAFQPSTKDATVYRLTYQIQVNGAENATELYFYMQKNGDSWYMVDKTLF